MDSYIPTGFYLIEDADGERLVPKPKTDRVTLRGDDALSAWCALRESIQRLDETIGNAKDGDWKDKTTLWRAEKWEAYQRIAKALGLKPSLTEVENA